MHLIVFPFFIYTFLGVGVLLFWPQRGLSSKNYFLLISSAMAALAVGFISTLIFHEYLSPLVIFYLPFAFFPAVISFLVVLKFGNSGFSLSSKESILYKTPRNVFYSGFIAIALGIIISLPVAYIGGGAYYREQVFFVALIVVTISFFCTFVISGFIKQPTIKLSIKTSLLSGAFALLFSFVMGPYFIIALPVVLFVLVSTFLFVYIVHRFNKNLTKPSI